MKRILLFLIVACLYSVSHAQGFAPITWTAYGLTFDAPRGILVEEDTEDTFLLNNSRFYIIIQSLESDDISSDELKELLVGLATDDGVINQSETVSFDLPQFNGLYLKGITEEDPCYYACLVTKDAGSIFYVSIIYNRTEDKVVEKMLKSFKMEEE